MNKEKTIGFLSAGLIYLIFGINIVFCKDLLNCGVASPTVILAVRITGATILFWLFSAMFVKEKIDKKDLVQILFASIIGISIPFLSSIWGIKMSTPLDASMINSLKPLFAIFASYLVFREKPNGRTWIGILVAIFGVGMLMLSGKGLDSAFKTTPLGLLLLLINGLSFAFYLTVFKPLIKKYHPITFMKWSMLFAIAVILPAASGDIPKADLSIMTPTLYLELGFIVIAATFLSFLLSPIAQKRITSTEYCITSNIQPISATFLSISLGMDVMTWQKLTAMLLMAFGIFLTIINNESNIPESRSIK